MEVGLWGCDVWKTGDLILLWTGENHPHNVNDAKNPKEYRNFHYYSLKNLLISSSIFSFNSLTSLSNSALLLSSYLTAHST